MREILEEYQDFIVGTIVAIALTTMFFLFIHSGGIVNDVIVEYLDGIG